MKKFLTVIFSTLLALALALFVGCKDDKKEVTLTLDKQTAKIGLFEELTLTASFSDETARTVAWSSSDNTVVTVSESGTVTGVKLGTATVTAQSGDTSATCSVTVEAYAAVRVDTNFVNNAVSLVAKTAGVTITPEVSYGGVAVDTYTVSYQSENAAVATVDENGLITPVAKGTANITVTANVGGVIGERIVSVSVANDNQLEIASSKLIYLVDVAKDGTTPNTTQLSPVLKVNGETQNGAYTYSVRDNTVATVNESGVVTAMALGETVVDVTATVDGETVSATVAITVDKARFTVPETTTLKIEKYAIHTVNSDKTYLDLSALSDYLTLDKLVSIKEDGEAVAFEVNGTKAMIANKDLGTYEFLFETTESFITVQCEYVAEAVKLLDMSATIMPYGADGQWKLYSNYQALKKLDITNYVTMDGWNWIKPAILLDGSAVYNYSVDNPDSNNNDGEVKGRTNWNEGRVEFSAAAGFDADSRGTYTWSGAKYLVFDYMLYVEETGNKTPDVTYGIGGTLGQWTGNFDGTGFNVKGVTFKIYDENGNRSYFEYNKWKTFVFDISNVETLTDYRSFIGIGATNAAKFTSNVFKNARLVYSDSYMDDYFTADFGFDGEPAIGDEATPSAASEITESALTITSLQTSDAAVVKVENGKFVVVANGTVTLTFEVKTASGIVQTVSTTLQIGTAQEGGA